MNSLYVSASGMIAQQLNMDVISNNLANVNTTGFKKNRVDFEDLYYQNLRPAGSTSLFGTALPVGIEVGTGVAPSGTAKIFFQGSLKESGSPLDLAIEGDGFFELITPGGIAYTRDGSFQKDANGNIVNSDGYQLMPGITIPANAVDISISKDGRVTATLPNQTNQQLGKITLVKFTNPAGLASLGENLYAATGASGVATNAYGYGAIEQGYLENSNVEVVEEMVNLIVAQRAFETASKAVQASDDMMGIANTLRR